MAREAGWYHGSIAFRPMSCGMKGIFLSQKRNSQKEDSHHMKEKLEKLLAEGRARIEGVRSEPELQEV